MHQLANNNKCSSAKEISYLTPVSKKRSPRISCLLGIGLAFAIGIAPVAELQANQRDQLKRIHDRLAGVPPTPTVLDQMVTAGSLEAAAGIAMQNPAFYNVTLKNFATPWTNEDQSVFEPLNDYSATVIGIIRDDLDYRQVLYGDIVYTGSNLNNYSHTNNTMYENLESSNADLSNTDILVRHSQSELPSNPPLTTTLPADATAGVMTTRAASKAFFVDGTNRAMFRFTLLNHLCYDLEQIKDNTRSADRIRQDVSRSPGGDSRLFLTNCLGCHSGMDPMAQAFANYEWSYKDINPDDPDVGRLVYTPGVVQEKYHINATNFKGGYFTRDSGWSNYWRNGPNAWLGWKENPTAEFSASITEDSKGVSHGVGAKSLGMELAHTDAFARCQVKKIFKTVCLRSPDSSDTTDVNGWNFNSMVTAFKTNYNMKQAFGRAAVYCSGN